MNKEGRNIFNVNKREEIYKILKYSESSDRSIVIVRGSQLKLVCFDILLFFLCPPKKN